VGVCRDVVGLPSAGGAEHGQDGPIPTPTPPGGDPGAALLVGALLWALVSVVVVTESANQWMRRAWGWVASFLSASLVPWQSFGRLV
jgi:hypothetical protein